MSSFATVEDIQTRWRNLTAPEQARATTLLEDVTASLIIRGKQYGKDLAAMVAEDADLATVAKSVTVDVVIRALNTSAEQEPLSQFSQSAMGYTVSGTYLVAGGGLFIKNSELDRLGLRRQQVGGIELYGTN